MIPNLCGELALGNMQRGYQKIKQHHTKIQIIWNIVSSLHADSFPWTSVCERVDPYKTEFSNHMIWES